ncbi:MAG: hypothetical protein IPK80_19755 [Nannocystis sp.]|nr:hypothetical protein [Nannocystis sp.]
MGPARRRRRRRHHPRGHPSALAPRRRRAPDPSRRRPRRRPTRRRLFFRRTHRRPTRRPRPRARDPHHHPDQACDFVAQHHRHLPDCNRRGLLHALAARWRGQIAAVALAGAPHWPLGPRHRLPPEGTLEITRVASRAGLRRYDRKGRDVPVNAASALVAHLIDLLPTSGRDAPGCRLVTYQLTSEDGAIYRALVAKGLRPVALSRHAQAGGARTRVALPGEKIRWEAGPAAATPDWSLLQPSHRPGAQAAFAAFLARKERR